MVPAVIIILAQTKQNESETDITQRIDREERMQRASEKAQEIVKTYPGASQWFEKNSGIDMPPTEVRLTNIYYNFENRGADAFHLALTEILGEKLMSGVPWIARYTTAQSLIKMMESYWELNLQEQRPNIIYEVHENLIRFMKTRRLEEAFNQFRIDQ